MNTSLKILLAIALISVTIAAGVFTIKTLTADGDIKKTTAVVSQSAESSIQSGSNVIRRKPDEREKPKFSEAIIVAKEDPLQPKYIPVNQPAYLQNIRTEGKTYHSHVMGKVTGQARKKDWGIRGSAYFTYVYGIESIGKILKNDGITIIEERSFSKIIENVIVSRYEIGFEIPSTIQKGFNLLCSTIGSAIEIYSGSGDGTLGAKTGWEFGEGVNQVVSEIKIPFTDKMFSELRAEGMLPKELDPERIKQELMMFTKAKNTRILEGKKVRILFRDGQGITRIEPIQCKLSQQEEDVIKRTNYVMDHYIFPDQKVAPESTWDVNGDVFAGFLDPRLHGRVGGKVTIRRAPDFVNKNGEPSKRLRLVNGNISFTDNSSEGQAITGQLSGIRGLCIMPDKYGVITSATMSGTMIYKNVSTDHLLFDAEMTITPRFDISYECSVE